VLTDDVGEELLRHAVLRLNGTVLGLVLGIILGLLIFVATNWLVIKGGPDVGPHLSLLGQFFIGYSVTFLGSLIGMAYGFVTGFLIGFFIGWLYNRVVAFRSK
jgi:ABC-type nitrate/sulfonate/bicarbonate transport system permease component